MANADERDRPEDLYPFAEALVRKLKVRHQIPWSEHRMEDAIQDLFPAGWQVWQDEEDVGLARNRKRDRAKNLLRDFHSEQVHEPNASSGKRSQLSAELHRTSGGQAHFSVRVCAEESRRMPEKRASPRPAVKGCTA